MSSIKSNTLDFIFLQDGEQGVKGDTGASGKTLYTWVKYSQVSTGANMTDDPTNARYIGISYNHESETESTNPADYSWTLIKGADGTNGLDGKNGADAYTVILTNENMSFATDTNGLPLSTQSQTCEVIVMKGATKRTDYTLQLSPPSGVAMTQLNKVITVTVSPANAIPGDSVVGTVYVTVDDYTFEMKISISVSKQGQQGVQGIQGIQGEKGEKGVPGEDGVDGRTTYFHIKYSEKSNPTSTSDMTETPSTYIGTYVDYDEDDSTDPADYTWARFQGQQGTQGIPGTNGTNGMTSYLHIKYSNVPNPTGASQMNETGGIYIGQYVDFLADDSDDPSKYTWSKIRGDDGKDGASITTVGTSTTYGQSSSPAIQPSSWSQNIPSVDAGNYLWTKTVTTFTDGAQAINITYARQGVNGANGKDGVNGKDGNDGTSNFIHIKYSAYPNPTNAQMTEVPSDYIGICINSSQPDPTTASSYEWSRFTGMDGTNGTNGKDGKDGTSKYVHFAYANSADGSKDFSILWFSGATYIGVRSDETEADSTRYSDYEWSLIKGEKGDKGDDGVTLVSSTVQYMSSTSGTQPEETIYTDEKDVWLSEENNLILCEAMWYDEIPEVLKGEYLWTKTECVYSDGTVSISYSVGRIGEDGATGASGKDGKDGEDGKDGADGRGILSTEITYQKSTSGISTPTGDWINYIPEVDPNEFLWTRTVITYTDHTTSVSYSVGMMGQTGTDGRSIDQIIVEYCISTSDQNNNHKRKDGTTFNWSTTKPQDCADGEYVWIRYRYVFSDGKVAYSNDVYDATTTGIESILDTQNRTIRDSVWDKTFVNVVDETTGKTISQKIKSALTEATTNIHGLYTTVQNVESSLSTKADGSTVQTLTERVTKVETTANGLSTTVSNLSTKVDSKADSSTVTSLSSRVSTVEQTANGLSTRVKSVEDNMSTLSTDYSSFKQTSTSFQQTVVSDYVKKTDLPDDIADVSELKTLAEQTATDFTWIVQGHVSSTNLELTANGATLISNSLTIKAPDGTTTIIQGGKINTNSITSLDKKSWINLSSGTFNYNDKLKYDGITLEVNGVIKANTGYIGGANGWTITTNKIYSGTVDSGTTSGSVTLSTADFTRSIGGTSRSALRFAIGSGFGVSNTGVLYANGAVVSGNITATTLTATTGGKIAGWTISAHSFTATNDYYVFFGDGTTSGSGNDNKHIILVRKVSDNSYPFFVRNTGYMLATTGKIGSFNLDNALYTNTKSLTASTTGNVYIGSDGIAFGKSYLNNNGAFNLFNYDGKSGVIMEGGSINVYANNNWDVYQITLQGANGYIGTKGSICAAGEIQSLSANAFRAVYGNYGFIIRNDGSNSYLMTTASGTPYGTWNKYITIRNSDCYFTTPVGATIGGALTVSNNITTTGYIYFNNNRGIYGKNTSGTSVRIIRWEDDNRLYIGDKTNKPTKTRIPQTVDDIGVLNASGSWVTIKSAVSDIRLKRDIASLGNNAINFIMGINPVEYRYKDGNDYVHFGFVAQQVKQIMDKTVGECDVLRCNTWTDDIELDEADDSTFFYTINLEELIAPHIKVTQSHEVKIAELKQENETLKKENKEMKEAINRILQLLEK